MEKLFGWVATAFFFSVAIAVPLLMVGTPETAIWPICLAASAATFLFRRGSTGDKLSTAVISHGIVFSIWCVIGLIALVVVNLFLFELRAPASIWFIAAFGGIGVVKELSKAPNPSGQ